MILDKSLILPALWGQVTVQGMHLPTPWKLKLARDEWGKGAWWSAEPKCWVDTAQQYFIHLTCRLILNFQCGCLRTFDRIVSRFTGITGICGCHKCRLQFQKFLSRRKHPRLRVIFFINVLVSLRTARNRGSRGLCLAKPFISCDVRCTTDCRVICDRLTFNVQPALEIILIFWNPPVSSERWTSNPNPITIAEVIVAL